MERRNSWSLIPAVLLASRMAGAQWEVTITRCATPPQVEGHLNDPCWVDAAALTPFVCLGSSERGTQKTEARLTFDDDRLYLGLTCHEAKMDQVRATVQERDGRIHEDDAVEVFLSPHPHTLPYYHFGVNILGTQRDDMGVDPEWNAAWEAATARGEDRWWAEIAIPFVELDIPGDMPEEWKFNLARVEQPHGELSTWAPCKNSFHEPDLFGGLRFEGADFRPLARITLTRQLFTVMAFLRLNRQELSAPTNASLAQQIRQEQTQLRLLLRAAKSALDFDPLTWASLKETQAEMEAAYEALQRLENLAQRWAMAQETAGPDGQPGGFAVCQESTRTKVHPRQFYHGQPTQVVQVATVQNEYEGLQLVIVPLGEDLEQVQVRVSDLTGPNGAVLGSEEVTVNLGGYVNTTPPPAGAPRGTGPFPDPLPPNASFDVPAAEVRSVWITFHPPPNAPPGEYHGRVTFAPANVPARTIDVMLKVQDSTLPKPESAVPER